VSKVCDIYITSVGININVSIIDNANFKSSMNIGINKDSYNIGITEVGIDIVSLRLELILYH